MTALSASRAPYPGGAAGTCSKLPGPGETVTLAGPLAEITAYLTGRANRLSTAGGEPAPALAPWL